MCKRTNQCGFAQLKGKSRRTVWIGHMASAQPVCLCTENAGTWGCITMQRELNMAQACVGATGLSKENKKWRCALMQRPGRDLGGRAT